MVSEMATSEPSLPLKGQKLNPDAPCFELSPNKLDGGEGDNSLSDLHPEEFPTELNEPTDYDDLSDQESGELPPGWDVEDFSPEWWNLVQSNAEFREYWLNGYEFLDFLGDGDDVDSAKRKVEELIFARAKEEDQHAEISQLEEEVGASVTKEADQQAAMKNTPNLEKEIEGSLPASGVADGIVPMVVREMKTLQLN